MERWDDLRLFLAVARTGTLSAAAKALRLSVSTVQRRVIGFEEDLGSVLFQKGPRGYQLTHAGEALLPKAQEAEEAIFAASRTVIGHDQRASGEVRFTAPLATLPLLGGHLADFARVCPNVRPVLLADDGLLDLGRSADVALRAVLKPVETAVGRSISPLAWCRYAGAQTSGQDVPWVQYLDMDAHPAVIWRKQKYPSPQTAMSVCGVVSMHAVLASLGAQGLLPCFVGDPDPGLRRIGEPVASSSLWLLIHADLRRSARVRALVDFLVPRLRADRALFEGDLSARDGV